MKKIILILSAIVFVFISGIFAQGTKQDIKAAEEKKQNTKQATTPTPLPTPKVYDWKESFSGVEKYQASILFTIPWGDSGESLPIMKSKWKHPATGKEYETISQAYRLFVDEEKNIYIYYFNDNLRKKELFKFSSAGNLIFHISDLKTNIDVQISTVTFNDNNIMMYDNSKKTGIIIDSKNGDISNLNKDLFKEKFDSNIKINIKALYKRKERRDIEFYTKKENKLLFKLLQDELNNGLLMGVYILGQDDNENIFIFSQLFRKLELRGESRVYLIHKYSNKGKLLTRIYFRQNTFIPEFSPAKKVFAVDSSGSIYQMWTNKEGVHIIRWSKH